MIQHLVIWSYVITWNNLDECGMCVVRIQWQMSKTGCDGAGKFTKPLLIIFAEWWIKKLNIFIFIHPTLSIKFVLNRWINDLKKWDQTIIEFELDVADKRRLNLWQWKSVQIISVKPTVISQTLGGILAWNYSQI